MSVLCNNSSCIYNGDEGYYGICNHPDHQQTKGVDYGGINRIYVGSCSKCERRGYENVITKKSKTDNSWKN